MFKPPNNYRNKPKKQYHIPAFRAIRTPSSEQTKRVHSVDIRRSYSAVFRCFSHLHIRIPSTKRKRHIRKKDSTPCAARYSGYQQKSTAGQRIRPPCSSYGSDSASAMRCCSGSVGFGIEISSNRSLAMFFMLLLVPVAVARIAALYFSVFKR